MQPVVPHPENVPGDFFVEDGCCLSCGVPTSIAPDLFGGLEWPNGNHCFVKKQPETPDERERMLLVIHYAEADCIHYRGWDRPTQERLVAAGDGANCIGQPDNLQRRGARIGEVHRPRFPYPSFFALIAAVGTFFMLATRGVLLTRNQLVVLAAASLLAGFAALALVGRGNGKS